LRSGYSGGVESFRRSGSQLLPHAPKNCISWCSAVGGDAFNQRRDACAFRWGPLEKFRSDRPPPMKCPIIVSCDEVDLPEL
jgi:hypothetical protein